MMGNVEKAAREFASNTLVFAKDNGYDGKFLPSIRLLSILAGDRDDARWCPPGTLSA